MSLSGLENPDFEQTHLRLAEWNSLGKVLQQLVVSYKKNLRASFSSDGAGDFGKVMTMPVLLTVVCPVCLAHSRQS